MLTLTRRNNPVLALRCSECKRKTCNKAKTRTKETPFAASTLGESERENVFVFRPSTTPQSFSHFSSIELRRTPTALVVHASTCTSSGVASMHARFFCTSGILTHLVFVPLRLSLKEPRQRQAMEAGRHNDLNCPSQCLRPTPFHRGVNK